MVRSGSFSTNIALVTCAYVCTGHLSLQYLYILYNIEDTVRLKLTNEITNNNSVMRQYYKKFNKGSLLLMYKAFIRLKLEYSSEVLANLNIQECERLENIQRSAIIIICGAKVGTSHAPLYREVKLQRLEERRHTARMLKFYEIQVYHSRKTKPRNVNQCRRAQPTI